jgi:hypothetical protein
MKRTLVGLIALSLFTFVVQSAVYARDAARDLRKMVGYSIVMADTVDKIYEGRIGDKLVKLSNGQVFKVDFLLLDPLPLTDVIVFAKPPLKEIVEKFRGKLPERMLYSYKLLIDNEAYDAMPQ